MQLEGDAALPGIEARYPSMENIITIIDAGMERVSHLDMAAGKRRVYTRKLDIVCRGQYAAGYSMQRACPPHQKKHNPPPPQAEVVLTMDIGAMAGHARPNNIMSIARSIVKGVPYNATHMRLLGDVSKEKGGGWQVHACAGGTAASATSSEDDYDNEDSEQEAGTLSWFGCCVLLQAPLYVTAVIQLPTLFFRVMAINA